MAIPIDSPIVVEGYCNGGRSTEQLRLSRGPGRFWCASILQSRYRLDASNLGIVALKSAPSSGVGRTDWDGIRFVVLKRKSK